MGKVTDAWPDECYTFSKGDRVVCTFNNKCGTIVSQRYNAFYQLVWHVRFDDGREMEIVTSQLKLINDNTTTI